MFNRRKKQRNANYTGKLQTLGRLSILMPEYTHNLGFNHNIVIVLHI